jgi:glycosyltransferase involved in cell wall biosynthesis
MLISVLIPARGKCEYLIDALQSLRSSTILPGEVILVNDGIEPDVTNKLEDFQDLNLRVIDNAGTGIVNALNTGIQACRNSLIARLDADDLILPERLSLQKSIFTQNPDLVLAGGNSIFIDETGKIMGKSNLPTGELNNLPSFRKQCLISHPTVMFRKEKVEKVNGYRSIYKNETFDLAEDFDLWLRLSQVGVVMNLENDLIKYRQHSSQVTSRFLVDSAIATYYATALGEIPKSLEDEIVPITSSGSKVEVNSQVQAVIRRNLSTLDRLEFWVLIWTKRHPSKFISIFTKILVRGSHIYKRIKNLGK